VLVAASADSARVKISSMQIRADTALKARIARVSVRLTASTDIAGLVALIDDLESGVPLLVVRELNISQGEPAGFTVYDHGPHGEGGEADHPGDDDAAPDA